MRVKISILFILIGVSCFSQTLPISRSVDWTLAGLRDTTTNGFIEIDMQALGVVGNGTTPNDSIVDNVLLSINNSGAILNFPSGNFLFNKNERFISIKNMNKSVVILYIKF